MHIQLHPRFQKQYGRLSAHEQDAVDERIELFALDQRHRLLRDHALTGKFRGYRSINVTGDIRAVYKLIDAGTALFTRVGSHSQLYG